MKSFNISEVTSETVNEFEINVDECMRETEFKLEVELERKNDLLNKIGLVQAQVSELWDRVDKARRRETDISYRVTAWAQHLSDQMNIVRIKKQQMGYKMTSSAALSEEIAENIERLAEKRDNVQRMREEIDIRRHLHKQQLRTMRNEMGEQEKEVKKWTNKEIEISSVVQKLNEKNMKLMERVEEEMRQESEQKRMLERLENLLKEATIKNKKHVSIDGDINVMETSSPHGRYINSFSSLTETIDIS